MGLFKSIISTANKLTQKDYDSIKNAMQPMVVPMTINEYRTSLGLEPFHDYPKHKNPKLTKSCKSCGATDYKDIGDMLYKCNYCGSEYGEQINVHVYETRPVYKSAITHILTNGTAIHKTTY